MAHQWNETINVTTPSATLDLCHHTYPTPNEVLQREEAPTLNFNITGKRELKTARYHDTLQSDYLPMGDVMFQPAGTILESRGIGGDQRFLRVNFDINAVCDTVVLVPDHTRSDIQSKLLNVRSAEVAMPLRRALAEMQSPGMASGFLLEGLSILMAVELGRYLALTPGDMRTEKGGLAGWQLRRIEERINDAAAVPPTVSELAELVRISPRHLARAYRVSRGCTLSDVIEQLRQQRAEQLVLAGHLPLKEIAHLLGFSGASSFSTAFRRRAGCSPQEFVLRSGLRNR